MSIPSRNVTFTKPSEPSFLKAFKAKVGYQEPVGIEAKRPQPPKPGGPGDRGDEEVEREDELPTVVVLRQGDISEQEFLENRKRLKEEGKLVDLDTGTPADVPTVMPRPSSEGDRAASPTSGDSPEVKIRFKKPVKRSGDREERGGVLDASSPASTNPKKRRTSDESSRESATTVVMGGVTRRRRRSSGGESKSRKVKNSSLLSFGDEEEED